MVKSLGLDGSVAVVVVVVVVAVVRYRAIGTWCSAFLLHFCPISGTRMTIAPGR